MISDELAGLQAAPVEKKEHFELKHIYAVMKYTQDSETKYTLTNN